MNKLFCMLIGLILISSTGFGQIRIAVIGGPHSASVIESNDIPNWDESEYSSKSGFHLGLLGEIPFSETSNFYFQPGLMYMSKGRKYFHLTRDTIRQILSDTISNRVTTSVNYIEIPLNLAYKIPLGKKAKFLLSAGPYVGFFFNGNQKYETRIYSLNSFKNRDIKLETGPDEGKVNTLDAGLNARAGLELGSLMITGFFTRGLTNFYTAAYDGTFKHQVKGVSLSFWLNGVKKKSAPKNVIEPVKRDTIVIVKPPQETQPEEAPVQQQILLDRDKDGVPDRDDECPDLKGAPELKGCPIPDTDGDGLNDKEDQCPGDFGPVSNSGCPVQNVEPTAPVQKEVEQKVNFAAKSILFQPESNILAEASLAPLDEVADLLQQNPSYKMVIEGHTDISGNKYKNKTLSQRRAETVKNYLIKKGIAASRLRAIGYGSERPIDSNQTPAGRARNRRVELKLAQ
jgi:OOP family OmpA-OmpF porin